ncbi:protein CURLY FLAG LEAF 1 [Fagus crenata]
MATITASLERSFQNCSLNQQTRSGSGSRLGRGGGGGGGGSSSSDETPDNHLPSSETTLELNSNISLPYHWEQCLDLKTGEIYYINWRNGMKAKDDPRTTAEYSGDFYSEDDSSCDSEESSSESSPAPISSREQHYRVDQKDHKDHVLVVAGCKSCLMYFMVPKQVEDCPKCCGQLLHFDRSENGSP